MTVSFYATLRPLVGAKTLDFPLPDGATLRALLQRIVERFPALGPKLLAEDGELARGIHVFVNGRGAGYLPEGLDTRVAPADVIDVFPAVAGG
ncbi:MAG: ubiquitin-like small modifier protein 1 [Myxococcota bacterium]